MFGSKRIRQRRKEKKALLELAERQKKYLIDCYGDIGFLQKMIELVNKDPELIVDLILKDGTKLTIRSKSTDRKNTTAALFNIIGD